MPKVRKARVRRHTAAVGSKYALAEKAAAEAAAQAEKAEAASDAVKANPFVLETGGSSSSTTNKQPNASATPADAAARPAKKLTKKDKRDERRKRFMGRLLLPGDTSKFKAKADLDMADMLDGLPTAAESANATQQQGKNLTSHTRKTIAVSEIAQFNNVLSHSAFRNNPIAALRAHLANSQEAEKKRQEQLKEISGVKDPKKKKVNYRPSAAQKAVKRKQNKKKKAASMAD